MKPILFSFGDIHLHAFGLMVALGVFVAMTLMKRKAGTLDFLKKESVLDLVFIVVVTGFLGGRVAYVLQHLDWYLENPFKVFAVWQGGLIFYGGVVGGILGVWGFSVFKKVSFIDLMDFILPYVALSHAFGRVGCFLNGCCMGKACELPWGVHFPNHEHAVHPTQLYETVFNLVLFLALIKIYSKKAFKGQVMMLYFLAYAAGRFMIEFFRSGNPMLLSLTYNQWMSIGLFVIAFVFYFLLKGAKKIHGQ